MNKAPAAAGAEQGSILPVMVQHPVTFLRCLWHSKGTVCHGVITVTLHCHARGEGTRERLLGVNWYTCDRSHFHATLNKDGEFYLDMEVCHYSFPSQKHVCLCSKQIQSFHTVT